MKDWDEMKTRKTVSALQWSVSIIVVIATMVLITGVEVPDWLKGLATWYVVVVGPLSLIVGMFIVWQLPGWNSRKIIVIAVELFILFCGVGLFHFQIDRAKADEGQSLRKAFLDSAEYKTALDSYNTALRKMSLLDERIDKIPGDFTTGAKNTTDSGKTAKEDFETAKANFIKIDAKAPKEPERVSAAGVFRIFGKENEGWVLVVVLFLLGLSYEAVALAVSWNSGKDMGLVQKKTRGEQGHEPAKIYTAEDYYAAATQGRTDGKVSGRSTVMEILNISERKARELYAECLRKGLIIPATAKAQEQRENVEKLEA